MLQRGIYISAVGSIFSGTSWEMPNSLVSSQIPRSCLSLNIFISLPRYMPQYSCNTLHLCSHCLSYVRSKHVFIHISGILKEEKRQAEGNSSPWSMWPQCFSCLLLDFRASTNTSPIPNR